jgi:hypothetical protein
MSYLCCSAAALCVFCVCVCVLCACVRVCVCVCKHATNLSLLYFRVSAD